MSSKFKAVVAILFVAGAAALIFLQYQTQQKLRAENESLQQQIAQLKSDSQDPPSANSKPTSGEDFDELLRLRGEVSALRAQTNQIAKLEQQNRQLREAFTNLAQERQRPAAPTDEQAFAMLQMNTAKASAFAMMMYASDHRGEFPTDFDQATNYFQAGDSTLTNLSSFEMTYTGSIGNLANPSSAIVVRQIQPYLRNGVWLRAYAFGDGHAEIHQGDANGNFDEWEQQHIPVLKNH
jgi:cell division protein FtsB